MSIARHHFDIAASGPLAGIGVIDLSRLMAGNMLSLQLADFGADVIKVEPPEGDPLRDWKEDGHSFFWKAYGRNKRSIALNLRHADDMAILWSLLESADVFIENYRPGTLEKMGLSPDVLLARNPRLVVVRISGFGQTGLGRGNRDGPLPLALFETVIARLCDTRQALIPKRDGQRLAVF